LRGAVNVLPNVFNAPAALPPPSQPDAEVVEVEAVEVRNPIPQDILDALATATPEQIDAVRKVFA
jgi:hypothetical protein